MFEDEQMLLAMRRIVAVIEKEARELGGPPHCLALGIAGLLCCKTAESCGAEPVIESVESWTNQLYSMLGEKE